MHGVGDISAGGVLRDNNGSWVRGFAAFLGRGSSLLAELWAIYLGLMMAKNFGCTSLIVE